MPEKKTIERAKKAKREGKSASTQAGEFVREEIDHVREGKHGVRNTKQAIAIGLSKARRSGVKLAPPKKGKTSEATRKKAKQDVEKGQKSGGTKKASAKRSKATMKALKRERKAPVSKKALSKQTKTAAKKRSAAEKSASAKKAARTKSQGKKTTTGSASKAKDATKAKGRSTTKSQSKDSTKKKASSAKTLRPGDHVEWDTSQGKTSGVVKKKLTSPMQIKKHKVAASKDNPEYLVQSGKSGKLAAHKPGELRKRK